MRIVSIKLHNIGLYADQTINFPFEGKSTTLFWGNNGAGKTTLLNSIKIGLLGQNAVKGSYTDYCNFVSQNLISSRMDRENEDAKLQIGFQIIEDNEKVGYCIERKWKFQNESLLEENEMYRGDKRLDFLDKERLQNQIKAILPSSLMNVLIFDGENALALLQKDQMSLLVRNIIFSVFGMDVYASTIKDLSACIKNVSVSGEDSEEQLRFVQLGVQYREALSANRGLKKIAFETTTLRDAKISSFTALVSNLSEKTGVDFGNVRGLKSEIEGMQEEKKNLDKEVIYINEEVLPLKILTPKIKKILATSREERPFLVLQDLKDIEKFFLKDPQAIKSLKFLETKISEGSKCQKLVGLSSADEKVFEKVEADLSQYTKPRLLSYFEEKNSALLQIKSHLLSLGKLNDAESQKMLDSANELSGIINDLNFQIESLENEISDSDEALIELKNDYEASKHKIQSLKKTSNSSVQMTLYRDALEEFMDSTINSICERLDLTLLSELKRINFRNNSITSVSVDPKNYEISLFEKKGLLIPSSVFSAGEKQILLGLIIKESLKLSGVDSFFLFDTPVGRLDASNRALFTSEVILQVSNQVAVFATDSDYDKSDYALLKEHLSSENVLMRDSSDQIVVKPGSIY